MIRLFSMFIFALIASHGILSRSTQLQHAELILLQRLHRKTSESQHSHLVLIQKLDRP